MSTRSAMTMALAPALSTGLLVAKLLFGSPAPLVPQAEVDAYFAEVRAVIEEVPYQHGPWLGADVAPTPAAVEMLKPNIIFQRRYVNAETGETFDVMIVHCGDVRDMIGHYPPVCYPAHGWTLDGKGTLDLTVAGAETQAATYRFSRDVKLSRMSIWVVNLFVIPALDGPGSGPELELIERAGRFPDSARLGSAQVQVIMPLGVAEDRRREIVEIAFGLVDDALRRVEAGARPGSPPTDD